MYKTVRLCFISLFMLMLLAPVAKGSELPNPRTMQFPALDFKIPKAERVVLKNGTPVYLLLDNELPIVHVSAIIRTGSVYDPAEKTGLASLTGSMLRAGGAGARKPGELDDYLEFMASSVESFFGADSGSVNMTTLTRNLEQTLAVFGDVLFTPRFDLQRLTVVRQQHLEAIRRRNDDPKDVGVRMLMKAIYAGHPMGAEPSEASVNSLTQKDLADFHKRFVRPDNLILTVSGDFKKDQVLALLNRMVAAQKPRIKLELPKVAEIKPVFKPENLLVQRDLNQSVIRLGHIGISKDDPDIYAIRVLDFILGGGFTSRLMTEIRTNRGLAYNVGSRFDIGRRFLGSFSAETETKADATVKVIELMKTIIDGVRKEPVTEQELALAKDYIVNSFLFGFTSAATVVNQQARLEFYGYPEDYLERYRERISAVSRADLLQAARKHLHPDKLKLVVVGDGKKFDASLTQFGEVRHVQPD